MNSELLVEGMGYAVAVIVLMAGSFWWGWQVRERLAVKLEFFRVSNRSWL